MVAFGFVYPFSIWLALLPWKYIGGIPRLASCYIGHGMGMCVAMSKGLATPVACPTPIILAEAMLLVLPLDPLLLTLGPQAKGLHAPKAMA